MGQYNRPCIRGLIKVGEKNDDKLFGQLEPQVESFIKKFAIQHLQKFI